MEILGEMTAYQAAGYVGVAFYIGSYALLQFGLIQGRGYLYAFLNLIGASLVLISLAEAYNLASAIIQITWITISSIGIARAYLLDKVLRFTEDEKTVLARIAPGLSKPNARALLNLGAWVEGTNGTDLTVQGEPISHLYWVKSGQVAVYAGGQRVAEIGAGAVLGEATVLTGTPATATVTVDQAASYFCIPAQGLRDLTTRNAEIRAELQESFSSEMRNKLAESNQRMVEERERGQEA
ncbi:MAG: cyclic nucleotide-binding domain-containing protein [Pseudomonadota bacterium]